MDPELRAAIAGMPYVGLADPLAARAAMHDLVSVLEGPVPGDPVPGDPVPGDPGLGDPGLGDSAVDGRVEVTDREIPGPPGAPPVPVRVYRPRRARRPAPVLVYFHGGGFVTGDLENEHRRCLDVAAGEGIAVVSVDYRLAPEHPFPAGFEDCYAATVWAHGNAAAFGGDPDRIAVGGGSAGGGLAAAVALRARDEEGPPLAFQLLLYPVLDDRMDTPSMRTFTEPPLFNSRDVAHMWRHYLGGLAEAPPYAAPARAEDLSGLPPAYLLVAEIDPLRDEDLAYAQRLIVSGVPTELRHVPGAYHGFDGVTSAKVARRALAEQRAVLRGVLDSTVG